MKEGTDKNADVTKYPDDFFERMPNDLIRFLVMYIAKSLT